MSRKSVPARRLRIPLLPAAFLLAAAIGHAQDAAVDLNAYYRFPLSVGVEYQSLTPLSAYPWGSPFTIFDISASVRVPIPPLPVLQPFLRAGVLRFDSQSLTEPPLKWDHMGIYAGLGVGYSHRFARNFEIGADLMGGFAEMLFNDLATEVPPPVGDPSLVFEAGLRISLNPSYSLTVEIRPSAKYTMSVGALTDFDGLLLGLGLGATFRFGQDPDAPRAAIRAIRMEGASIPGAFAAMQSWYASNPLGTVTLVNTEKYALTDVEISFYQKGYMDSPTSSGRIPTLAPGEKRDVSLYALFNDEVFRTEGVTPLTGEVQVSYKAQGRAVDQSQSVGFDLYDKRAMTWDDDRKVSAFITPDDSALKNYGGFIRQSCRADVLPGLNDPLQLAMQVFSAVGETGCLYQADAELPITRVQGDPRAVDTVNLARETLKTGLGDCDDLTVLYCSILEALAVDTGFITVPGHIYAAFDTKIPSRDFRKLHTDRAMGIEVQGTLWVPVEITLIGKASFMDAWRRGVEEWQQYDGTPEKRSFIATRKAREVYRPVGLKETDLGLQYGSREAIVTAFRKDRDKLAETLAADLLSTARASGKKEDWNRAGAGLAQLTQYSRAEEAFNTALAADRGYLPARINLGSLLFIRKRYAEALTAFTDARALLDQAGTGAGTRARVLINISRTYYELERYQEAKDTFAMASAADPETARQFSYLGETSDASTRASSQPDSAQEILFVE